MHGMSLSYHTLCSCKLPMNRMVSFMESTQARSLTLLPRALVHIRFQDAPSKSEAFLVSPGTCILSLENPHLCINNRIDAPLGRLWKSALPSSPGGRKYSSGCLRVDSDGSCRLRVPLRTRGIHHIYPPIVPPPGGLWGQSPSPHTPLAKSRWRKGSDSRKRRRKLGMRMGSIYCHRTVTFQM
jgi:hypothetical protein